VSRPRVWLDETLAVWKVDFRQWGHGRRNLSGIPPAAGHREDAVHAAYALLMTLERERMVISPPAQAELSFDGRTLRQVAAEWLRRRKWRTEGGRRWSEECCARIVRELGHAPISAFAPPGGWDVLAAWTKVCRQGLDGSPPIGPKRMQDLHITLKQILKFAAHAHQRWLGAVPEFPDYRTTEGEKRRNPRHEWIGEADFRAIRAGLYTSTQAVVWARRECGGDADRAQALIEQRRLFLSFGMYTGQRKIDLGTIVADEISADFSTYIRKSQKNRARPLMEHMPAPLVADVQAELVRLGRPWRAGEKVCGGPWRNAARVVGMAARKLGLGHVNLRILRRSFVRMKALAGVPERDLIELMGHSDSEMIREVYLQIPRQLSDAASAAWPAPPKAHLPGRATVTPLRAVAVQDRTPSVPLTPVGKVPSKCQTKPKKGT
jgi:integrase